LKDVAAEKIIAVTKVSDVTTLDEAVVPQNPSSPNIKRNVLLGFVVGGVFISALVILSEVLDDRVKKPEDVEEVMGVTLIGVIPSIKKL
jgi:polysaccharide export protein